MGNRTDGRYIGGDAVTLQASVTKTANFVSSAVDLGSAVQVRLSLNVTVATGTTPSMTVTVEHSPDNSTWTSLGAFTAATAVSAQSKVLSGVHRYVRANAAVTGTTPSFTYSVSGTAQVL